MKGKKTPLQITKIIHAIYFALARLKKTPAAFRKLMSSKKSAKEQSNRHIANMADASKDASSALERFFGEVSKKSATKQVLIGATSGW